jgi:hypothetical protein
MYSNVDIDFQIAYITIYRLNIAFKHSLTLVKLSGNRKHFSIYQEGRKWYQF